MTAEMRESVALPGGLRERVIAASRQVRAVGRSVPDVTAASPTEAFGLAADAFYLLLRSLRDEDWAAPVIRDLDAQGLVGHLIGVEHDVHRCLAGDPEVARADHVESTNPQAARQAGRDPAMTSEDWRRAADHTLSLVDAVGDLGATVAVHGIRLPLRDVLVARTFELWTHDNDIRTAIALPASVPDPATLRPMTKLATELLPFGAARTGLREPISLHLVLTGPGGGSWDILLGKRSADLVQVGIVADVVGFCRLVANRVAPADLDVYVTGDRDQATAVLTAASALALD